MVLFKIVLQGLLEMFSPGET